MSTLKSIFSNIFDIYPDDTFVQQFVQDNNINIDKVLSHPLLKFNTLYCQLWNAIYKGTYPTRKDFQNITHLCPSSNITDETINHMIRSFTLLNLGLQINSTSIKSIVDLFRFASTDVIKQTIYEKLSFRYGVELDKVMSPNLFVTVVQIMSHSPQLDIAIIDGKNPLSGHYVKGISFNEQDMTYMTSSERLQYIIFKDIHFLMKLLNNVVIYDDQQLSCPETLQVIIKTVYRVHDCHVVLFKNSSNIDTSHDPLFTFIADPSLYRLLPSIAKAHITLSADNTPRIKPLSATKEQSIYYLLQHHASIEESNINKTQYGKLIMSHITSNNDHYVIHEPLALTSTRLQLVIDLSDQPHVLGHLRNGKLPIVKNPSLYSQHMITGVVAKSEQEAQDFIKMLSDNSDVCDVIDKGCRTMAFVMSEEFISMQWTYHLKHACPIRTKNPRDGMLLYVDFLAHYYLMHVSDIMTLTKAPNSQNCLVLIDNRPNILSVMSILISLANLNENWSCVLITSEKAMDYYKTHLENTATVHHDPRLDVEKFHIDVYNRVMMEPELWEGPLSCYEKCLIVQDDGILLRPGIDKFIDYDYVGAPWVDAEGNEYIKNHVNPHMVGNGGLSLRTVDVMKQAIHNAKKEDYHTLFFHNINHVPEDIFFCKQLHTMDAKMPTAQEASFFSSEEILNFNSLGLHKVWCYHDPTIVKNWFNTLKQKTTL